MTSSTRDAILALRKEKNSMECFETAESIDTANNSGNIGNNTGSGSSSNTGSNSTTNTLLDHASKLIAERKSKSEDVVQLDIKPSMAFAKFAGKLYTAAANNTSSNNNNNNINNKSAAIPITDINTILQSSTSSSSSQSPFNPHSNYFESPIDKFNRLKSEIYLFRTDLSQLINEQPNAAAGADSTGGSISELSNLLYNELSVLDSELLSTLTDPRLKALLATDADIIDSLASNANANTKSTTTTTTLQSLIQSLQSTGNSAANIQLESKQPPTTAVTTGNNNNNNNNAASALSILASLDRRLAAIERTIGLPIGVGITIGASTNSNTANKPASITDSKPSIHKSSSLTSIGSINSILPTSNNITADSILYNSLSTQYPDINSGLMTIHSKLSLLDSGRLEIINRAIKSIITDLELLETQKSNIHTDNTHSSSNNNSSLYSSKINELYELLFRFDSIANSIPILINRLTSLKSLIQSTTTIVENNTLILSQQSEILTNLKQNQSELLTLSESIPNNFKQIQSNFDSIDSRLNELNKKIATLK